MNISNGPVKESEEKGIRSSTNTSQFMNADNVLSTGIIAKYVVAFLALFVFVGGCQKQQEEPKRQSDSKTVTHPEWSRNANIYEVNIRQYTPEGTFKAFEKELPRLQDMGVKILWLMPVQSIGKKNRKGSLGSYYSVRDYKAVNPHFGNMEDFKSLVKEAHQRGMKVILDWVANHTAWDNVWTEKHPEWYNKDEEGNFKPPVEDWSDVIDLNYKNKNMRSAMIEAMKFWVKEANIDGYRCDVAAKVPIDFWIEARKELDSIKPVFMLAEADKPKMHKAFDMTYAWDFHFLMNKVAAGDTAVSVLQERIQEEQKKYAANDYRMMFTSNHDENSWKGSVGERLGKNTQNFAVLAATMYGMPLVYSGQEAGLDKRLKFFEKDTIQWNKKPLQKFYQQLLMLKRKNKALWNGNNGGKYVHLKTNHPKDVFAYQRIKGDKSVVVVLNFSDESKSVKIENVQGSGRYQRVFESKDEESINKELNIKAHNHLVLQK